MKRFAVIVFFMNLLSLKVLAHDKKPWIYFDLGDTVVNTKDMLHLRYMPGAREYMEQLKREGYKLGIISNIPENWGMDYEEKLLSLKKVIQDGWEEDGPFDWSVYDEILLPLKNTEMKPSATLFLKAISIADVCPSAYIGESPKEIVAAQNLGMAAKLFNENDSEIFIPVSEMRHFLEENYHRDYDKSCF
ncbi:MAG: hypothetical protein WC635_17400 [Bacteriovorax sp.]|jgi:phosphoglycolate phosphatase-like HAD superfamily hydrolase